MTTTRTSLNDLADFVDARSGEALSPPSWTPYYLDPFTGENFQVCIEETFYGNALWYGEQVEWLAFSVYTCRSEWLSTRAEVVEWLVSESVSRPYGTNLVRHPRDLGSMT